MGFAVSDPVSGHSQLVAQFPERTADIFLAYSVIMPPNATFSGAATQNTFPDVSSWKFTWLTDGEDGYHDNQGKADLCVPSHAGKGSMIIGGNDGNLRYISGGRNWWDFNNVNYISFYAKPDRLQPQTSNGEIYFQAANIEHGLYRVFSTDRVATLAPPNTYQYDRIRIPGWWGNGDGTNFQAIYDNIYIATGENYIARIELTDSATYSNSKKVFVIPYDSWSDTEIKINIDKIGIPDIKTLYIYIIDQFGARSKVGVPVCNGC